MEEIIYSADSSLRSPGRFVFGVWSDLRVSPPLAWSLFRRGLQAGYRQSRLGYFWLLLPPLATAGTWAYLNAARIVDIGPTRLPYPVFVLTGTLLWQVFADALHSPLQQLSSARAILAKSRLPHEALLLAGLIEVLFNFAVRLLVLLPVLLWFKSRWDSTPTTALLLVPFGVAALLLLGFTAGLMLTPLGMLYQDVPRGLSLVAVFWFFLTPVIYPLPTAGVGALVAKLNPVAPLLDATRNWLTSGSAAAPREFVLVVALTIPALTVAWFFQRLARPHVVARLG
ncbi:MAG: lipopolysaccharide transport system permease protein [Acidobacteriota bacterium]|jgi:lipopolysaccharide transport system permease protein|nr:lipopolysaccharide transport system permease protein [Acidobacteriota bacterium]